MPRRGSRKSPARLSKAQITDAVEKANIYVTPDNYQLAKFIVITESSLSQKKGKASSPQPNPGEGPTALCNPSVVCPQFSTNDVELATTRRIKECSMGETDQQLLSCGGLNAQRMQNILQRVLDRVGHDLPLSAKRRHIKAMQTLGVNSGLYPRCCELNGHLTSSDLPESTRASTDIYKASLNGQVVCIKTARFRVHSESEHFLKVVSKEAIVWGQLRHNNILPFYGVYRYNDMISFATPWMANGNIQSYLEHNKDSNRCSFVSDVTHGLQFLHENDIVHGDLKGPNVLVNSSGQACLTDFGLASVSDQEVLSWASLSSYSSKGGSVRWQAPELFNPNVDEEMYSTTKASDIYAFGSVAYEILAGQVPFAHLVRDTAVMNQVLKGERPTQPSNQSPSWSIWGLTEGIWALIEACWDADPVKRPTVELIMKQLGQSPFPENGRSEIQDVLLLPTQVRKMIQGPADEHEMSVETLESLLASAGE